jgi:hypothetical protein
MGSITEGDDPLAWPPSCVAWVLGPTGLSEGVAGGELELGRM